MVQKKRTLEILWFDKGQKEGRKFNSLWTDWKTEGLQEKNALEEGKVADY